MTAEPIEAIWTAIALAGLALAVTEGFKARRDLAFLVTHDYNGRRKIVAQGHWRREVLRAIQQALFALAGVAAMLRPPSSQSVGRYVIMVLLVTASSLIVYNSWLDKRDRQRLINYWRNVDLKHVASRDRTVAAEKLEDDTQRRADEKEVHDQRRHDETKD